MPWAQLQHTLCTQQPSEQPSGPMGVPGLSLHCTGEQTEARTVWEHVAMKGPSWDLNRDHLAPEFLGLNPATTWHYCSGQQS